MLWVLRTGAPWRDLPDKFGNWNRVYRRHLRWRDVGVWEAVLAALSDSLEDNAAYSIDSTIERGHAQAAGAKGGLRKKRLIVTGRLHQ
jgi:transposase